MADELELEAYWSALQPRLKGGKSCKARLLGQVFGRLRVVSQEGSDKHGATLWRCICTCGNEKVARRGDLKRGLVKSCGCLLAEYRLAPNPHRSQSDENGGDLVLQSGSGVPRPLG